MHANIDVLIYILILLPYMSRRILIGIQPLLLLLHILLLWVVSTVFLELLLLLRTAELLLHPVAAELLLRTSAIAILLIARPATAISW